MLIRDIKVGDVVSFQSLDAGKPKRHICISPCRFLFINTEPSSGAIPIKKAEYPRLLDYDSFIGITYLVDCDPEEEIRGALIRAHLTVKTLREIVNAIQSSRNISIRNKRLISGHLATKIAELESTA